MSEQRRTRTRRKLKFIVFPVFTSIFATRKRHYKTRYKTFPTDCSCHLQSLNETVQDEPKDCRSVSSRQMPTEVWQPRIAILCLLAEMSTCSRFIKGKRWNEYGPIRNCNSKSSGGGWCYQPGWHTLC